MRKLVRRSRRTRAVGNNHRNRVRALASSTALVAISTLSATPSQAQTTNWLGGTSTDWYTAGNWDNGVPAAGVNANLDNVTPNPTLVNAPGAAAGVVSVGIVGTGQLTIANGGTLNDGGGRIGDQTGSQGTVIVTGAGSTWINSLTGPLAGTLVVGANGAGTLTIADGGEVRNVAGTIALHAGSEGTVTVIGHNSTWISTGELRVGDSGTATLTVANGGAVSSGGSAIGRSLGSQGTVTVTGNSTFWFTGALDVGRSGTGTLSIANGGLVSSLGGTLGGGNFGQGTVTVTGAGSKWVHGGGSLLLVGGIAGTGTLIISDGGAVSNPAARIGDQAGSQGTVAVIGNGSTWTNSAGLTIGNGATGTLTISGGGAVSNTVGRIGDLTGSHGMVTVTGNGSTWTNSAGLTIGNGGTGTLVVSNGGTVTSGTVLVAAQAGSIGSLNIGAAVGDAPIAPGTLSTPAVQFGAGAGALNFNHTATDYVFAPQIAGGGSVNVLSGTTSLTAANTYTGPTTVDGGALIVNGSIASSSLTTVNPGGTLGGTGTVSGAVQINTGGILAPGSGAPGTSLTTGNLTFAPGAIYQVQLDATGQSSKAIVNGSATLGGANVQAVLAPGSYTLGQSFNILTTTGGVSGTFAGVSLSNTNFAASLSYPTNNVFLSLTGATLGAGTGLNDNQQNVANAINDFFNGGGTLPPGFVNLFGLTGGNLANALPQLSGEAATGAQQGAFQLTHQFLGTMLDPFVYGSGPIGGGGALGFARESGTLPEDVALAYAKVVKAPPAKTTPAFEQRWSVWGAGYGGYNTTDGDPVVTGSHDLTARAFGFAAGVDYRFAPGTVVGVALAGGGTKWDLAQGLGGGKSDAFQAGLYGAHRSGAWYVAGALAFTNHWMSTDRVAAFGDHLTADFNAQSFGGRIESGYRFATMVGGVTPYGAVQAQSFHTPAYSEIDISTGGFGLNYNSRTGTDTRTELGARFDRVAVVGPDAVLTLRGRLAWAHDWITDPTLAPVFQALPGSSFIVNGAAPAENSALVSAGAELRLASGVSLLGKFDGEFANNSQTYAGTATLRYTW
jgi:outer membrane autotransporter protein